MEGLALVLIGAAVFSHSWYLLEVYPEGRTMGIYVAAFGLAGLIAIFLTPMVLTGVGVDGKLLETTASLAELTIMKALIILWAGYAVGVGAHGMWDFDDRAIGFYCAFLAVVTLAAFFFFASGLRVRYGDEVWLALSGATAALTVLAGMLFFYLAIPFSGLRSVAAWFLLIGSVAVAAIGLAIMTNTVSIT